MQAATKTHRLMGLLLMIGFTGISLASCRAKVLSFVDEIPPPKVPISHAPSASNSSYKVVGVTKQSNAKLSATIVDRDTQIEVTVDCATGVLQSQAVIPPDEQPNLVQEICSRVASNISNKRPPVRVVRAGDGYANLRSGPSTEVTSLAQVPNGTSVTLIAQTTNSSGQHWFKVQANGQVGWIHANLLD